jgi:Protein of unknown function (DUF2793)
VSDSSPNLILPYIMAAQAQKHVTHNEAIRALDAIVHLAVLDRDLTGPPSSPADGQRYIVAASPSGSWAGQTGKIAAWQDGAWAFYAPQSGWLAWVIDEALLARWTGSTWAEATIASVNPVAMVGVNAIADTTNRLSVASPASLFNHSGSGHQIKINKAAGPDTASQLFQTAFSGRAEIGLTGDDNLHVKVSADGTAWSDALVIVAATGTPRVPSIAKSSLPAAATAGAGAIVHVSDEAGGTVLAFSDGTTWRRVTDRAAVS